MNLTIKNIPEPVYRSLKDSAARHGRSLNAEVIQSLANAAILDQRRAAMRQSWMDLDRFVSKQRPVSDSVPLIRVERGRR